MHKCRKDGEIRKICFHEFVIQIEFAGILFSLSKCGTFMSFVLLNQVILPDKLCMKAPILLSVGLFLCCTPADGPEIRKKASLLPAYIIFWLLIACM